MSENNGSSSWLWRRPETIIYNNQYPVVPAISVLVALEEKDDHLHYPITVEDNSATSYKSSNHHHDQSFHSLHEVRLMCAIIHHRQPYLHAPPP